MSYKNPNVKSSYKENDLGRSLYDAVILHKPKKIIEFGSLEGYSAIAMAMALKDLGEGRVYANDLWEMYPYTHSTKDVCLKNIKNHDVEDFIELGNTDFFKWLKNPGSFDMLHIDISNDASIMLQVREALHEKIQNGAVVIFEGGTIERDNVGWMLEYKKMPMHENIENIGYKILNSRFPSMSIMKKL